MATDERLERLLDAVLAIASDLSLPTVLRRIVTAASDLVEARYGALGVIGEEGTDLVEFVHTGMDESTVLAIGELPKGHGILGKLIEDPRPLRLADLSQHAASYGFPPDHPPMTTFLGAPIRVGDRVFGNLYLSEKRGGVEFTQEDEDLVVGVAAVAGAAIENARLYEDLERRQDEIQQLRVLEDRERIGRDLHDTVIQRLFATGLALQAAAKRAASVPEVAVRIQQAVDELDETIREIRTTIFQLQSAERVEGLRSQILDLCEELTPTLGFRPSVAFEGAVDTAVGAGVAEQLLRVLREALTNVAKHAQASRVDVGVHAQADEAILRVADDGIGVDGRTDGGFGLRNIERRARSLGGSLTLAPGHDGGTLLEWRVPLP